MLTKAAFIKIDFFFVPNTDYYMDIKQNKMVLFIVILFTC